MNNGIVQSFINNIALLLALFAIYEFRYLLPGKHDRYISVINGIFTGAVCIALMNVPFNLYEGIFFDARTILVSVTALVFGTVPVIICSAMAMGFRALVIGGDGWITGILTIFAAAVTGILWRHLVYKKTGRLTVVKTYVFGVIVHILMLLMMVFMPVERIVPVLEVITVPVLVIFPLVTVLLSMLLMGQKNRNESLIRESEIKKALVESEARFRMLVEGSPDAIFIQQDRKFVFVNRATQKLFGADNPEDLLGKSVEDRIHSEYREKKPDRFESIETDKNPVPPMDQAVLTLDGKTVYANIVSVPVEYGGKDSMIVFARDVTQKKFLEEKKDEIESQLRQKQKLEAIGTLAGGVAHEINNPINGIMNYAQLIADNSDAESRITGYANDIIDETERISEIVKSLLQFSRHEKQAHSYADLYDIIEKTVSLIRTIMKHDQIEIITDLQKDLPAIKCRSQQIQQVIMNILTNARDALNEKYPGYHEDKKIYLTCRSFTKTDRKWVNISIKDKGNGMSEEVREKILTPFFSTKPKEKGTGLGLSISFGIISDHHGELIIDSKPGEYSEFSVILPVDNGWEL